MKNAWLYDGLEAYITYQSSEGVLTQKTVRIKYDSERNNCEAKGLALLKNLTDRLIAGGLVVDHTTYKIQHKKGFE